MTTGGLTGSAPYGVAGRPGLSFAGLLVLIGVLGTPAGLSAQDGGDLETPDPWTAVPSDAWSADGRIDFGQVPAANLFDFLLGQHTYSFGGGSGEAAYEPAIDGRGIRGAIHGSVQDLRFGGASLTFQATDGSWQRRWIDTLGNVLIGQVRIDPEYEASDLPALVSHIQEPVDGVLFRHVWYDVSRESFGTDLLASQDRGETWVLARRMPYVRVGGG